VLLVGQDPYHDDGQAHGLCFSVRRGVKLPPSLRNIYKEIESDVGVKMPKHGCLEAWADRGVLLLNTVLTVRAHEANSHRKKGWEVFTDRVIAVVAEREDPVVFVLWGKPAQSKLALIEKCGTGRHAIVMAAHPSPLSANAGFFGSQCFSKINAALAGFGKPPIDWSLPPE
jgi:uracil-DNA glycosylase